MPDQQTQLETAKASNSHILMIVILQPIAGLYPHVKTHPSVTSNWINYPLVMTTTAIENGPVEIVD